MADGSQTTWLPPGATAPEPAPRLPDPAPEPQRGRRRLFGPLIIGFGLLVKYGKFALLFAGKAKFLTTSGSMLVSVAAYSLIWGWTFALGFVLLLLVHEMGHVIQLRREGVEASAPMFIPFLGAVVAAKSLGDDAAAEARVGLAGPVLGTLGAVAVFAVGESLDSEFLRALAFTGFFLNLFNLIPLTPLDGGRAMAAMSPWMWFVGLFLAVGFAFAFPNPIIILVVIVGVWDTFRRWKRLKEGGDEQRSYYRVSPRTRLLVLAVYLGLIAVCVLGMDLSHIERTLSDV
jgi:Zn-dependent protease